MNTRDAHNALVKAAVDKGLLLEAGFLALRVQCLEPDASDRAVGTARMLYMAGAQHLFASLMAVMDPGGEPTAADMRRISLIAAELQAVEPQLRAMAGVEPTQGTH